MLCTEGNTKGCIAAHSISNMFFILRKDYTAKERREILSSLCTIFDVEGIDKAKLLSGLANEDFLILRTAYRWSVQRVMVQIIL